MQQFYAIATEEGEESDINALTYTLGESEPSFDFSSMLHNVTGNDTQASEVSAFLNSFNSKDDRLNLNEQLPPESILQPNRNQQLVMNNCPFQPHREIPLEVACVTMNNPVFYDTNDFSTIQKNALYNNSNSCSSELKEEPSDYGDPSSRNDNPSNPEGYRNKRDRNNVAVRKSRDKAKVRRNETQSRVSNLREENKQLEEKIKELLTELNVCRSLFIQKGAQVPGNLESVLNSKGSSLCNS